MKESCLVVFTENKDHYNMEKQLASFKEDADIYRFSAEESYDNLMKMAKNAQVMGYKNFYYLSESDDWQEMDFDLQRELKGKFIESGVLKGNFRRLREAEVQQQNNTQTQEKPVKTRAIVWPDTIPAFVNDEYDTSDLQKICDEKTKIDASEKSWYKVLFPRVGSSTRGSLGTQNLYDLASKALSSTPNQDIKKMLQDIGVNKDGVKDVNFYDTAELSKELSGVSEIIATKSTKALLQSFTSTGATLRTVPEINDDSPSFVQQKIDEIIKYIQEIKVPADVDASLTDADFMPSSQDKTLDKYSKDFAQQIFINYVDNRNGIIYSSINTNVFVQINNNYTTYNTVTNVIGNIFNDAGNERVLADTPFAAMYKAGKQGVKLAFDKDYQKQMWNTAAQATAHFGNGDISANFAKRANDIDLAGKRDAELVKAKTNFNQRQDELYKYLNEYCGLNKEQFDKYVNNSFDVENYEERFNEYFIKKYNNYVNQYLHGWQPKSNEEIIKKLVSVPGVINKRAEKMKQLHLNAENTYMGDPNVDFNTWENLYNSEKSKWIANQEKERKAKLRTSNGAKIGELIDNIATGKIIPEGGILGDLGSKIKKTKANLEKETDASKRQLIQTYLDDAEKEYSNELNNFKAMAKEYMLNRNYQDYKINKSAVNTANNISSNKSTDTSLQGQLQKLNKLADQDKKKLKSIMKGQGAQGNVVLSKIKQILSK